MALRAPIAGRASGADPCTLYGTVTAHTYLDQAAGETHTFVLNTVVRRILPSEAAVDRAAARHTKEDLLKLRAGRSKHH